MWTSERVGCSRCTFRNRQLLWRPAAPHQKRAHVVQKLLKKAGRRHHMTRLNLQKICLSVLNRWCFVSSRRGVTAHNTPTHLETKMSLFRNRVYLNICTYVISTAVRSVKRVSAGTVVSYGPDLILLGDLTCACLCETSCSIITSLKRVTFLCLSQTRHKYSSKLNIFGDLIQL